MYNSRRILASWIASSTALCIMLTAQNILKIPYQHDSSRYKRPNVQEAWDFFFPNSEYIENSGT